MNHHQNPRIALTWAREGKRSSGRPKEAWRKTAEGERQKMGFATWMEAAAATRNGVEWRKYWPYSTRGELGTSSRVVLNSCKSCSFF